MMTEKEKAANGLLYDSTLKSFEKKRRRAKRLCHRYNRCKPSKVKKRNNILKKLFGKTGKKILIEPPFYCDYGDNIEVGDYFSANMNCVMLDGAEIKIGNHVMLGPNVSLYGTGHPKNADIRNKYIEYSYPITIQNNVWIGGSVSILPGVTIGENSIIGAGSVVTKNIPRDTIAYGNPCRIVKTIDQDEEKQKEKYFRKIKRKEFKEMKRVFEEISEMKE